MNNSNSNSGLCKLVRGAGIWHFSGFLRSITLWGILLGLGGGCAPGKGTAPFDVDLIPPILRSVQVEDERHVRLEFDEPVMVVPEETELAPSLDVEGTVSQENGVVVAFAENQAVGMPYVLRMGVEDASGNILLLLCEFTGHNPQVPEILINELNPEGSGNNPDCVELRVMSNGNLGGLILRVGTNQRYDGQIRFPALEVMEGDYIVVHTKAEGIPEEVDELGALDASGGLLACDTARDFWMPDSPGLPGTNGAVALYDREGGQILDAVLYSNRTTDTDDERLGWTAAGYDFAQDLAEAEEWGLGEIPGPSDAIAVVDSSATRSLCRMSSPVDTNTKQDWHIVPNSRLSFGEINSDEVYESSN
ncbi:MAG: hypothetical protein MI717_02140 [Spirochaetales bacterium]|nr:hypothetical protein [Spirochaetales bacterium]